MSNGSILIPLALGTLAVAGETHNRKLRFNGKEIGADALKRLQSVEKQYGFRLPDRAYWYDNQSGAIGLWKGPTAGFLPAGLQLGGAMPADSSTGGTGVFINGRELHPVDVLGLRQFTVVLPGRWWVDAYGNGGPEGGPMMFNLVALAQSARSSRRSGWSRRMELGGTNMSMGGDGNFLYFMDNKGNSAYIGQ